MARLLGLAAFAIALTVAAAPSGAGIISYQATLDGPSEFPANASPGTGLATVDYDNVAHTLHVS